MSDLSSKWGFSIHLMHSNALSTQINIQSEFSNFIDGNIAMKKILFTVIALMFFLEAGRE